MTRDTLRTSLKNDGIDHINISPRGETELGRVLFLDWQRRFHVPGMGSFQTARSFANWMVSGGDDEHRGGGVDARYFRSAAPITSVNMLMVFGKYFQLRAVRQTLETHQNLLDLPWVGYRKHPTGVREYDRWADYGAIIKGFVEELVDNAEVTHDWAVYDPDILEVVNFYLKKIAGDDFVPFELIGEVIEQKKKSDTPDDVLPTETTPDRQLQSQGQSKQQRKKNKGNQKLVLVGANSHKVSPPVVSDADQQSIAQDGETVYEALVPLVIKIPMLDDGNSGNSTVTSVTRSPTGGLLVEVGVGENDTHPEETVEEIKKEILDSRTQNLDRVESILSPNKLNDLVNKFQP